MAGTYSTAARLSCKHCAAGTYNSEYGELVCKRCSKGTYSSEVGNTAIQACKSCVEGTYNGDLDLTHLIIHHHILGKMVKQYLGIYIYT